MRNTRKRFLWVRIICFAACLIASGFLLSAQAFGQELARLPEGAQPASESETAMVQGMINAGPSSTGGYTTQGFGDLGTTFPPAPAVVMVIPDLASGKKKVLAYVTEDVPGPVFITTQIGLPNGDQLSGNTYRFDQTLYRGATFTMWQGEFPEMWPGGTNRFQFYLIIGGLVRESVAYVNPYYDASGTPKIFRVSESIEGDRLMVTLHGRFTTSVRSEVIYQFQTISKDQIRLTTTTIKFPHPEPRWSPNLYNVTIQQDGVSDTAFTRHLSDWDLLRPPPLPGVGVGQ